LPAYLGIETSCDETAAAIVVDGRKILSNKLFSQISTHQKYGGVVPELAAREHLQTINLVIDDALSESGLRPQDLAGIAYTAGPGLIGALLVGAAAAKTLSFSWSLPLIAVDHLSAHICANYLESELEPPFVALLVSGGHTQIIHCLNYNEAHILGESLDDAAGEAYDKVARLLGLEYPGGPAIDRIATTGNPSAFKFPEGVVDGFNFSFSGLKTAVARCVQGLQPPLPIANLAASFQEAVVRVLVRKTIAAQNYTAAPQIVLAGGVCANSRLRSLFSELSPVPVYFPKIGFCTDNAAMVASAAYFCGMTSELNEVVYSRTPLLKRYP
jgi:N6-L-threonylcarbamoyladenine synthase